jgi:hypothetical protein
MEGLEIYLENFKPTGAHLAVARLCVAGRPGHHLTRAHHFAHDRTHRAVSTAESVAAGACHPTWVAGHIPVRRRAGAEPPLHCRLLTLLTPAFSITQLAIERYHRPPPSSSEWRIGSTIVPSSHCTRLQHELSASDTGSCRSLHYHLFPRGSPSTTVLHPPPCHPRVLQAPL